MTDEELEKYTKERIQEEISKFSEKLGVFFHAYFPEIFGKMENGLPISPYSNADVVSWFDDYKAQSREKLEIERAKRLLSGNGYVVLDKDKNNV